MKIAPQREVLRTELISRFLKRPEQQRRLLILSPRRGGARTLVRQMVAHSDFPEEIVMPIGTQEQELKHPRLQAALASVWCGHVPGRLAPTGSSRQPPKFDEGLTQ
jgi:hypothetical protein